jgi:hypothetical protein
MKIGELNVEGGDSNIRNIECVCQEGAGDFFIYFILQFALPHTF